MAATKKNYQIPFDEKGNMLSYDYGAHDYKDPYEFTDTLTYVGYGRGRSAAHFYFKDSKNKTYNMFISDFDDLIKTGKFSSGTITATFTFVKKGQNFGIQLVK